MLKVIQAICFMFLIAFSYQSKNHLRQDNIIVKDSYIRFNQQRPAQKKLNQVQNNNQQASLTVNMDDINDIPESFEEAMSSIE